MAPKRSVLLALTDTHHGFFKGAARYAREHRWHVVADMIYTAKIPIGWRGDGILSFIGDRDDLAEFILSSDDLEMNTHLLAPASPFIIYRTALVNRQTPAGGRSQFG